MHFFAAVLHDNVTHYSCGEKMRNASGHQGRVRSRRLEVTGARKNREHAVFFLAPISTKQAILVSTSIACVAGVERVGDWEKKGGGLQPATSISYFLTPAIKFSFLALALSLFFTLMLALLLLLLFFVSLKGRMAMRFIAETHGVPEMQNFTTAYMKWWKCTRTDDFCFHLFFVLPL